MIYLRAAVALLWLAIKCGLALAVMITFLLVIAAVVTLCLWSMAMLFCFFNELWVHLLS